MTPSFASLALILAALQVPAPGIIQGTVRSGNDVDAPGVPYALVQLLEGNRPRTVTADRLGRYRIEGVPAGLRRLQASRIGYRTIRFQVDVPPGQSLTLDLDLTTEAVILDPLVVEGTVDAPRGDSLRTPSTDLARMQMEALGATTGMAETGLAEVARGFSSSDPTDPTDALLMRGSAADLKLVLLDGAPVVTPFHVAGLIEPFDRNVFGSATKYVGGAPARYDGGLANILDLRTRIPRRDRLRMTAAVDLLSARASVEGPVGGRGSVMVGGRTLHGLSEGVLESGRLPYDYRDAVGRLHWALAPDRELAISGFFNEEAVRLDLPTIASELGVENAARWQNRALSARFAERSGAISSELGVAVSRYQADLPIGGADGGFLARGHSRRLRLSADFRAPLESVQLRFGGSFDKLNTRSRAWTFEDEAVQSSTSASVAQAGVYLEGLKPLTEAATIRAGLRLDHFGQNAGTRLAPRVSLKLLLSEDALLTVAGGVYHQLAPAPETPTELGIGHPASVRNSRLRLPIAAASHLVVALDQTLAPGVRMGIQGFVKRFSNVATLAGGRLNTSGMDLRVVREGASVAGWLGYSLNWSWTDGPSPDEASDFAARHLLSVGVEGQLSAWSDFEVRAAYGSGLPYTSIPLRSADGAADAVEGALDSDVGNNFGAQNTPLAKGPTEPFLRIDAALRGHLQTSWLGRPMTIAPYLKILNALDRRDSLFFFFEPWRDDSVRPLAELSVLPVLGVEWRF